MSKLKIALLLVFSSGQICGSQIFGGGGLNRPQGMPRGGILNPDGAARMGGGILGGHGIGTFPPKEFPSLFRHRPGHSLEGGNICNTIDLGFILNIMTTAVIQICIIISKNIKVDKGLYCVLRKYRYYYTYIL